MPICQGVNLIFSLNIIEDNAITMRYRYAGVWIGRNLLILSMFDGLKNPCLMECSFVISSNSKLMSCTPTKLRPSWHQVDIWLDNQNLIWLTIKLAVSITEILSSILQNCIREYRHDRGTDAIGIWRTWIVNQSSRIWRILKTVGQVLTQIGSSSIRSKSSVVTPNFCKCRYMLT